MMPEEESPVSKVAGLKSELKAAHMNRCMYSYGKYNRF